MIHDDTRLKTITPDDKHERHTNHLQTSRNTRRQVNQWVTDDGNESNCPMCWSETGKLANVCRFLHNGCPQKRSRDIWWICMDVTQIKKKKKADRRALFPGVWKKLWEQGAKECTRRFQEFMCVRHWLNVSVTYALTGVRQSKKKKKKVIWCGE